MERANTTKLSIKDQLGVLVKPMNLVRTAATCVPGAGIPAEILNQIEGERVDRRLCALESTDTALEEKLQKLEATVVQPLPLANDWPVAVQQYMVRHVDLAVLHYPPEHPDREYILPCT